MLRSAAGVLAAAFCVVLRCDAMPTPHCFSPRLDIFAVIFAPVRHRETDEGQGENTHSKWRILTDFLYFDSTNIAYRVAASGCGELAQG